MGSLTAVRTQIALGADLEARNEAGQTPVGLAVSLRETAIAEILNRIRAVQRAARDSAPEIREPSVKVLRPGQSRPENAPPVRETRTTTTQDGIVVYDSAREEQIAKPAPPRAAFPNTPVWPPPPDYVLSVDGRRVPTNPVAAQFAFDAPSDRVSAAPVSPVASEKVAPLTPAPKPAVRLEAPAPADKPAGTAVAAPEPAAEPRAAGNTPAGNAGVADRQPARPQQMVETVRIPKTKNVTPDDAASPTAQVEKDAGAKPGILDRIGSWFAPTYDVDGSAPASPVDEPQQVAAAGPVTETPEPEQTVSEEKDLLDVLANLFRGSETGKPEAATAGADGAEPVRLAAADEPLPTSGVLPKVIAEGAAPLPAEARLPSIGATPAEPASRDAALPPVRARAAEPEPQPARLPAARKLPAEPMEASAALPQMNASAATPDGAGTNLPPAKADSSEPGPANASLPRLAAASSEPVPANRQLPRIDAAAAPEPVIAEPVVPVRLEQQSAGSETAVPETTATDINAGSGIAWPPAPERPTRIGKAVEPLASSPSLPVVEAAPSEPPAPTPVELAPRLANVDEPLLTKPSLPAINEPAPEPEPVAPTPAIAEASEPLPSIAALPAIDAAAEEPVAVAPTGTVERPSPALASIVPDAPEKSAEAAEPATEEPVNVAVAETPAADNVADDKTTPGLFDRFVGFLTGSSGEPTADPAQAATGDAVALAPVAAGTATAPAEVEAAPIAKPATSTAPAQYLPGEKRVVAGAWPPAPVEPVEPPPPMPARVERVEKRIVEPVQTASIEEGPAPSRELPLPAWTSAPAVPVETFAFSSSVHLGHRLAEGEAESLDCLTHIYRHRRNRIRACVVDVKWPRDIRPDFVSNSIIYVGQKAVVIYQDGVAAAMYALFRTEAYDRIASHFASQYGPSIEYRREKVQLMAGGREINEISVWRATVPASGLAMEMEMRRFDDVRDLFGDPYHGMIEIRFAESRRVFQFVQPLDLMTNR
ncbi:MAG: hypothetical protein RJQ21_02970 [Rhodospirillales bacterium]